MFGMLLITDYYVFDIYRNWENKLWIEGWVCWGENRTGAVRPAYFIGTELKYSKTVLGCKENRQYESFPRSTTSENDF